MIYICLTRCTHIMPLYAIVHYFMVYIMCYCILSSKYATLMPNLSIDLSSTILHSLTFAVRLMLVDCPLLHCSILLKERVVAFVLHSIPLSPLSLLTPILIPMIMIVHHPTTPSLPSNGCSTYNFGTCTGLLL